MNKTNFMVITSSNKKHININIPIILNAKTVLSILVYISMNISIGKAKLLMLIVN